MTSKDFELLQEKLVLTVKKITPPIDDSGELPFRSEFDLKMTGSTYEPEHDRYNGISEIEAVLTVYVDKNLGCFSDDARVEMVSAKVKHIMVPRTASFPTPVRLGARIDICFDSLANIGYIRTVYDADCRMDFAASGYLKDYDFDDDPVEPLPAMTLDELVEQMKSKLEQAEPKGAEKTGEDGNPDQGEQPKEHEESPAEEEPPSREAGEPGIDGYTAGAISEEGVDDLLKKMGGEPAPEDGDNGGSEGADAEDDDGESKSATKKDGGKKRF